MLDALAIYAGDKELYSDTDEKRDFWTRDEELEALVGPNAIRFNHPDYLWLMSRHKHLQTYGLYPFGNGMWGDQPQWLLDDFATINLYLEWRELRRKYFVQVK